MFTKMFQKRVYWLFLWSILLEEYSVLIESRPTGDKYVWNFEVCNAASFHESMCKLEREEWRNCDPSHERDPYEENACPWVYTGWCKSLNACLLQVMQHCILQASLVIAYIWNAVMQGEQQKCVKTFETASTLLSGLILNFWWPIKHGWKTEICNWCKNRYGSWLGVLRADLRFLRPFVRRIISLLTLPTRISSSTERIIRSREWTLG